MARNDPHSVRLHPALEAVALKNARELNTSLTWIVEAALADYFRDSLPPGFRPGMPHVEAKQEDA